jgi:serine/threonine protein kinase
MACDNPIPIAKHTGKTNVSKVFVDAADFNKEFNKVQIAAQIDPNGSSMLYPYEYCTQRKEAVVRHPAAMECKLISKHAQNKTYYIMNMPYGGKRFDDYVKENKPTPIEFLKLLLPILQGIVSLEAKGYCQQDIKAGNLLVTPGGKGMIIDFTLMAPLDVVFSDANRRRLRYSYFPYPPEYKIYEYIAAGKCKPCRKTTGCDAKRCNPWPDVRGNIMSFGSTRSELFMTFMGGEKALEEQTREFYEWAIKQNLDTFAAFAKKVDVYSLGVVCAYLFEYLTKKHSKIDMECKSLFMKMAHPNPRKRISASNALERANALLSNRQRKTRGIP